MQMQPPQRQWTRPFVAICALLLALVASLAWRSDAPVLVAVTWTVLLAAIWLAWRVLRGAEARAIASEADAATAAAALVEAQATQVSRSDDLALLGRYGNLLIGGTDLAEILQISQQMLSLLLPESAGTIYPLIDGEGLAEATHLWGTHVAETRLQASAEDCLCMQRRRVHLVQSDGRADICAHVSMTTSDTPVALACIPLIAQGESLGWIFLSAPVEGAYPKLQLAIAAADQLALALANLKLRQSLRDLSVRDPLTGLFNRRYLSESLGREMARSKRRGLPLAVLAFDLDHFKVFNDSYGHPAGDAVLVAFAHLLQSKSRNEDIACRQGGEEFVLIMPEMDESVASRRAGELMLALESMGVVHDGAMLPALTTSIGLAVFPEHGVEPDLLLANADTALYQAKLRGRNQVVVACGS